MRWPVVVLCSAAAVGCLRLQAETVDLCVEGSEAMRKWTETHLAAEAATPPFSFRCGGKSSAQLLGHYRIGESVKERDYRVRERLLTRTDPASGVEVRCEALEYSDYHAVDWVVRLKNVGTRDTPILEDLQVLDTCLPHGADQRLIVHHSRGSDAAYSDFAPLADTLAPGAKLSLSSHGRGGNRGGCPSVECLPFFDVDLGGHGVIIGIGWTGPWAAKLARDAKGSIQIQVGMERMHLLLHPGEEIRGPRIVLLFWQGDRLRAHNLWRRLLRAYYSPTPAGKPFNGLIADGNWGSWMNADRHTEEINWWADHALPMECYWIDAGWTDMSLGWEAHQSQQVPNPSLFPLGLKPLSEAAHRRGMKFLLWMVPGSVHPAVGIGKEHPDWLGQPFRDKAYGPMVFHGLDHGNPKVNQFMIDHFSRLVSDFGIDIFRQDGANLWPEDTDPNRCGMSQIRYIQGFYEFWDGLLARHPHLLIDNCAEGGRKIDLETIRRSIVLWRSDCQASGEFDPVSTQGFTYGLLSWIPLCGAVAPMKELNAYSFRSAYCPAILIGWPMMGVADLKDRWSNVDVDRLRKLLEEYVAIRPYVFGDFYPLTPYSIDHRDWLAWQYDRPDLAEGMVQAFRRPDCPASSERYRLCGLDPDRLYLVRNLDQSEEQQYTGRALMQTGLRVDVPSRPGAAVVTYKRAR